MNFEHINTKRIFTTQIDLSIMSACQELADSPISLAAQLNYLIGYYYGVCMVKDWDPDIEYTVKWCGLVHNSENNR